MFYCNGCRVRNSWPQSLASSVGTCECCGRITACNDRPASTLPPVKEPTHEDRMVAIYKQIGKNVAKYSENQVLDLIGRMHQDLYLWTGIDDTEWINDNIINPKSQIDED